MGVLITDNLDRRRDSRLETAIIKVLQTEIPIEKFMAERAAQLADYIDFRVEHLQARYQSGEFDAYIRLTEIEALKDFLGKLGLGGERDS